MNTICATETEINRTIEMPLFLQVKKILIATHVFLGPNGFIFLSASFSGLKRTNQDDFLQSENNQFYDYSKMEAVVIFKDKTIKMKHLSFAM